MSHFSKTIACVGFATGLVMALSTQLSSQTAKEYEGQVDGCTLASVSGWVLHNKQGTSITVAVNGKTLATNVSADMPRPDVARLTKGTENSGFDFKFPAPVAAGDKVQVKFADGAIVSGPQGQTCTVK
jgi:hypothetical protein